MKGIFIIFLVHFSMFSICQSSEDYYIMGNSKSASKEYYQAIVEYTKAIEINPFFVKAYLERASAKQELSDYLGAIQDYSKVIDLNSQNEIALSNRGLIRSSRKIHDYIGAISDFTKLIEINPYKSSNYFDRGDAKYKMHDYRGAIIDFSSVIKLDPKNAEAYSLRGIMRISIGQKTEGCLDLSKAGELGYESAFDLIKENCN